MSTGNIDGGNNTGWNFSGGGVTLLPPLVTNSNTFYSATVAPGAVTLTQTARFNNSNAFYSATVGRGAVNLAPNLVTNTNVFYSATVTTSAAPQTLLPSLFVNANTFYSPTVTAPGATQTLVPSLFSNANAFYSATVTKEGGDQTLFPSLFVNTNVFYRPTVTNSKVMLVGGGGGEDHSRTGPINPKRKVRKHGFANERAQQEAALQARFAKPVEALTDSKLPSARKTARRLDDYINDRGTADALQKQLDRLQVQLSVKASNDDNQNQLNEALKAAAAEIQEFLDDERDAIDLLMLVERNEAALLFQAIGIS